MRGSTGVAGAVAWRWDPARRRDGDRSIGKSRWDGRDEWRKGRKGEWKRGHQWLEIIWAGE